jgi:fumarate hydratase class II
MMPVIAYNLLQSIDLLEAVVVRFHEKCVEGITANREKCLSNIETSLAMCTALVPAIGYEASAEIAKEAFATGKTVREVALAKNVLPEGEIIRILDEAAFGSS